MSGYIGYEVQFKITSPDGVSTYIGSNQIGVQYDAALNSTVAALSAEAVIADTVSAVNSPVATTAGTEVLSVARSVDGTSVGYVGVTFAAIAARTGATGVGMSTGRLAGMGSIVPVRCTAVAIAAGSLVVSSATAAQVMAAATKAATVPAYGTVLGMCVKARATVNSVDIVGVLVNPQ